MWPIDENARRGRISVCMSPPNPPTRAFRAASTGIRLKLFVFSVRIHKGAIFCHVDRKRAADQFSLDMTAGYQLWNGDIPNFINIAIKIVNSGRVVRSGPIRKIIDAYAWMKKYFIVARTASGLLGSSIIGIKAMVLISNLAHV